LRGGAAGLSLCRLGGALAGGLFGGAGFFSLPRGLDRPLTGGQFALRKVQVSARGGPRGLGGAGRGGRGRRGGRTRLRREYG
jgi:hypothetical protein